MSIIDEARASVALDHDARCGTQSGQESALEWLCQRYATIESLGYIAVWMNEAGEYACTAKIRNKRAELGRTPAEAIVNCARAAGWPG